MFEIEFQLQTSPFPPKIPTVFLRKILRINTENFIPYLYAKALDGLWSGCCVAWVVGWGKMEGFGVSRRDCLVLK